MLFVPFQFLALDFSLHKEAYMERDISKTSPFLPYEKGGRARYFCGSSEIRSDKVSLLHIKGTQRGREHRGESIKTISRRCRRHKERQSRSVRIADSFGKKRFKKSCKHCFVMK